MPERPLTGDAVLDLVRKSELADDDVLKVFLQQSGPLPSGADDTATRLVQSGILTPFQARFILQGKYKGFRLGPYRILDQIGVGGMGQVYLAEHVHLRRQVALKVLPAKLAADASFVERFYREARAVAALNHPNVVRAYDVACERGTLFLVLEYVRGKTLAEVLGEAAGALPVALACDYAVQAAAGLHHAHEKGIAHCDVKPANLLVATEGIVKILDMGLAKFFQASKSGSAETSESAAVMGTADYIAPEQATACSAADRRADIYSLGATLYHLLAAEPPFRGTTAAKLIAHQLQPVPSIHESRSDVPVGLSFVIAKMMAKQPRDRYPTASDAIEALLPFTEASYCDYSDASPEEAPLTEGARCIVAVHPACERQTKLVLALSAAIVVVFAAIVGFVIFQNS